jgi:hypothetical protein
METGSLKPILFSRLMFAPGLWVYNCPACYVPWHVGEGASAYFGFDRQTNI